VSIDSPEELRPFAGNTGRLEMRSGQGAKRRAVDDPTRLGPYTVAQSGATRRE